MVSALRRCCCCVCYGKLRRRGPVPDMLDPAFGGFTGLHCSDGIRVVGGGLRATDAPQVAVLMLIMLQLTARNSPQACSSTTS